MKTICCWIGICVLLSACVLSAQPAPLSRETLLQFPNTVHSVHVVHINNDEIQDLMICHLSEETPHARAMTLLLGQQNAAPDTSGISLRIHPDDILFDLADLDGDGLMEYLSLRRDGIYANRLMRSDESGFRISQFRPLLSKERIEERFPVKESENQVIDSVGGTSCLIQTESAFAAPDPTRIRRFPLALDLDEDGLPEICVPQSDRLAVYRLRDGVYHHAASLWIRPAYVVSESDPAEMTARFPECRLLDFNGDGRKDLLAILDNGVDVFLMHGLPDAPVTSIVPPDWTYDLGARRMVLSEIETLAPVSSRVEVMDLNADGFADLIVILAARSGFTGSLSQIHIHLNRYGRIRPLPDQILTSDNFLGEHLIRDFNGDGLLDLALFDFRLSYGMALRLILTRKVKHTYDFYLMRQDGSYPQTPDYRCSTTKKPRVSDPESALFGACYAADFDGDGRTDLLTPVAVNRWQMFLGDSAKGFDKKRSLFLDAPLTRSLKIADINGDGAEDCIFFYPDQPDLKNQVRIILSAQSRNVWDK